jgi:hypothetical protein
LSRGRVDEATSSLVTNSVETLADTQLSPI